MRNPLIDVYDRPRSVPAPRLPPGCMAWLACRSTAPSNKHKTPVLAVMQLQVCVMSGLCVPHGNEQQCSQDGLAGSPCHVTGHIPVCCFGSMGSPLSNSVLLAGIAKPSAAYVWQFEGISISSVLPPWVPMLASTLLTYLSRVLCKSAYAGHAVLSSFFPWRQSSVYDLALERQLQQLNLNASQLAAAESAGRTEAVKLVKER